MKLASEVVETLKLIKFHLSKDDPGSAMEALQAFREEGVKESLKAQKCKDCGCTYEGCCCNPIREMKARAEALEEAAKLIGTRCEDLRCSDSCYHEHAIRALKDKP